MRPYLTEIFLDNESSCQQVEVKITFLQKERLNHMTNWLIAGNPKMYDVVKAFHDLGAIDWSQKVNAEVGDVVYIYVSGEVKSIRFKCRACAVNKNQRTIEDSAYIGAGEFSRVEGRFMELEMLEEYQGEEYSRDKLMKHGFQSPQGQMRMPEEVIRYLETISAIQEVKETSMSELYTPEWFAKEAEKDEWRKLDSEADALRAEFLERFSPEKMKALSGRDLLTKMFFSDVENKDNLCYWLEMHKEMRRLFGSILGGSAYKYGLFYYKKQKVWTIGSPAKPIYLSEEEAIEKAGEIRDGLVKGAEIIENFPECSTREDYERLYAELNKVLSVEPIWIRKYYQMIFPDRFPVFYGKDIINDALEFLHLTSADNLFVDMGQIRLFIKKCGISCPVFARIYYPIRDEMHAGENNNGDEPRPVHYWLFAPGDKATLWDDYYEKGIMAIGWSDLGDLSQYKTKAQVTAAMQSLWDPSQTYRNQALTVWQFLNDIRVGDIIFAKKGRQQVLGRGVVTSEYYFDPSEEENYKNLRRVQWTHKGEWDYPGMGPMKTLTDITTYTETLEKLNAYFDDGETEEEHLDSPVKLSCEPYTEEDFLSEVFMDPDDYRNLVNILTKKKNIILEGAPGVGKTFAARRLAYSIIGEKDPERVTMIQFHQSYSYEDFIEGYRPSGSDFVLKKGAFYRFCKLAAEDSDNDYFFIIDEINRGNLSKIFGELFMLIETDKRGKYLNLLYSDELFTVPANVHIIGMMNTADRSLALMDYALRRRFAFIGLKPGFETDGFVSYQEDLDNRKFDNLIECVKHLNKDIADDTSLGEGFCIGHSYFCDLTEKTCDDDALHAIVEYELIPLLREYWFDEADKVNKWSQSLRSAVK